jgi:uncharacterized membrane protein YeaQ/YmgE (transglycosylase-associated protein family)
MIFMGFRKQVCMSLFSILMWVIFGAIAGTVAKWLHPGDEGISGWGTLALGVVGSFVGGLINWILGWGDGAISSSGLLMSIAGAFLVCMVYVRKETIIAWVKNLIGQ